MPFTVVVLVMGLMQVLVLQTMMLSMTREKRSSNKFPERSSKFRQFVTIVRFLNSWAAPKRFVDETREPNPSDEYDVRFPLFGVTVVHLILAAFQGYPSPDN